MRDGSDVHTLMAVHDTLNMNGHHLVASCVLNPSADAFHCNIDDRVLKF